MKKYILKSGVLIILHMLLTPVFCSAQIKNILQNFEKSSIGGMTALLSKPGIAADDLFNLPPVRDPFLPQLPQKPKIVEPPPVPAATNTPPPPKTPAIMVPTSPLIKPPPAEIKPPPLNITGLIWNSDQPQAIINGKVIRVGDEVDNVRVTDIQKNKITISHGGKDFTILYNP
ncbi:MAG: hypothetical protein A2Z88_08675 [Omnitrophica WOR_2 bacterium GWA2_47_8]|nr:MAG: hypothetical protein A2Z88_08675 [Omnitrophica WOR_2 bacterium GWA2_47_8]